MYQISSMKSIISVRESPHKQINDCCPSPYPHELFITRQMLPYKIVQFKVCQHFLLLLILDLVPFRDTLLTVTAGVDDVRYHDVRQSSAAPGAECPRNWTRYERTKSCFYVIERRMRWSEAERACVTYGGHLASIIDEYENTFAFNVAKLANLSTPTLWLGRLVKLTRTGAYEWNDGAIGRHADGFRGEPPSGTDLCLTMWLDFDRPEGSWNEWDCNYAIGYSALCKRSLKRTPVATTAKTVPRFDGSGSISTYISHRCCLVPALCHNVSNQHSCTPAERCVPDDLNCWTRTCPEGGIGWCLPLPPTPQPII